MTELRFGYGSEVRESTIVSVCSGKSCRKRDEHDPLEQAMRSIDGVVVTSTRCLGICDGPVIAIDAPGTRRQVLAKVRSHRTIADAIACVRDRADLTDRLRRRRVKGKQRRKALDRLDR